MQKAPLQGLSGVIFHLKIWSGQLVKLFATADIVSSSSSKATEADESGHDTFRASKWHIVTARVTCGDTRLTLFDVFLTLGIVFGKMSLTWDVTFFVFFTLRVIFWKMGLTWDVTFFVFFTLRIIFGKVSFAWDVAFFDFTVFFDSDRRVIFFAVGTDSDFTDVVDFVVTTDEIGSFGADFRLKEDIGSGSGSVIAENETTTDDTVRQASAIGADTITNLGRTGYIGKASREFVRDCDVHLVGVTGVTIGELELYDVASFGVDVFFPLSIALDTNLLLQGKNGVIDSDFEGNIAGVEITTGKNTVHLVEADEVAVLAENRIRQVEGALCATCFGLCKVVQFGRTRDVVHRNLLYALEGDSIPNVSSVCGT